MYALMMSSYESSPLKPSALALVASGHHRYLAAVQAAELQRAALAEQGITPIDQKAFNRFADRSDIKDFGKEANDEVDEDGDEDSYGNADVTLASCYQPSGYVSDSTDCDDNDNDISPAASELCNDEDAPLLFDVLLKTVLEHGIQPTNESLEWKNIPKDIYFNNKRYTFLKS